MGCVKTILIKKIYDGIEGAVMWYCGEFAGCDEDILQ